MNLEAYSSVHNRVVVSLDCFGFVLFLSKDFLMWTIGLPWWLSGKESACSAGDAEFNPGVSSSPHLFLGSDLFHPLTSSSLWSFLLLTSVVPFLSLFPFKPARLINIHTITALSLLVITFKCFGQYIFSPETNKSSENKCCGLPS